MNRIQEILSEQGRMQSYLCRELGKSANTVSLWCRNKVQPSLQDLYKIAELLNCEVADLLIKRNKLKDD
ncbi:MAG: helix-turn-helix transcriptional regulator [Flavobacteriales bacterium]|nr:helix-turn-helix transcriptional regulator [Flavobacteriales bacterium]